MLIQTASTLWLAAALMAPAATDRLERGDRPQPRAYQAANPHRHFVSLSYERQYIQPYSFAKHPLAELLGQPVDEVHLEAFQYRTRDQLTQVTVQEYGKRADAIGLTIYPFGSSTGPTLAINGSISAVPDIRVAFAGPAPAPTYELTNGRAFDLGAGVDMSDRAPGWGLGAHAFLIGGIGHVHTDQLDGRRYFAEGGGGVSSGPFGVDISFKYTINRFSLPVTHSMHMIPISVRGTLTF
jgi:hypothetical protein